jgi:hypothetical protein
VASSGATRALGGLPTSRRKICSMISSLIC